MPTLKSAVLAIQSALIEADVNVDRIVNVPAAQLEQGVHRMDIYLDIHVPKDHHKMYIRLAKIFKAAGYGLEGSGNFWEVKMEHDATSAINFGVDVDNDNQAYVGVEEHTEEFLNNMMGERQVTTFKDFLAEARKPGVSFTEEKTKGQVTKVIAELEAHEAARLTRLAREYHKIMKLLDKLEKAKSERNAQLKELIGTTFDAEADKYYTRVLKSATFAATLARETHPDDIAEKVEIQYEKLVDGLMALLSDELKPAGDALLAECTRRWKPDPKSPNLSVKKIDEGLGETVRAAWRKVKELIEKHLSRFDKGLKKLEDALPAYVAARDAHVVAGSHKSTKAKPTIVQKVTEGKTSFKQFIKEGDINEGDPHADRYGED